MNRLLAVAALALVIQGRPAAYPLDGYPDPGIRRVELQRLIQLDEQPGSKVSRGALLPTAAVDIRLRGRQFDLPPVDAELTRAVVDRLGILAEDCSIAVLDLSDPARPRYAEYRGDYRQNVGSVGKLVAALGLFQGLADAWPENPERRENILRHPVYADRFAQGDHHRIRLYDVTEQKLEHRPMLVGDRGSLWEYLDWMLSISSNAAAAIVMREAMLLRRFGRDYPAAENATLPFFQTTPATELTALYQDTFWAPVSRQGISLDALRQGSFFTREGKRLVNGGGLSYGTARSLMQYLLLMEQGRLVDDWSSTRLKRLLYLTEHRIRYASSPALADAAVYFKSGSLYSCKPEPGFDCGAYRGNERNYMNSVAIIEQQFGDQRLHYAVVLLSNVLKKNAALAHQQLATAIHQLLLAHYMPES